ncbi:MAG: hypothetical protein J6B52_05300, partial [Clostridia bacterium]|nr:hypothetical protein [Clostridia bacterium]
NFQGASRSALLRSARLYYQIPTLLSTPFFNLFYPSSQPLRAFQVALPLLPLVFQRVSPFYSFYNVRFFISFSWVFCGFSGFSFGFSVSFIIFVCFWGGWGFILIRFLLGLVSLVWVGVGLFLRLRHNRDGAEAVPYGVAEKLLSIIYSIFSIL